MVNLSLILTICVQTHPGEVLRAWSGGGGPSVPAVLAAVPHHHGGGEPGVLHRGHQQTPRAWHLQPGHGPHLPQD